MYAELPAIEARQSKEALVEMFRAHLNAQGFTIAEIDATRPWGAFLRIVNEQADKFVEVYFGDLNVPDDARHGERSPKILLVAPQQRLSWQYHDRRSEVWRVIGGQVGMYVGETDEQPPEIKELIVAETIEIPQGIRHRLVGLEEWSAVAEIWIHTDPHNPSNEDDIYRLQDDYKRMPL
jgi:mannose-6-phosphate isomerase